MWFTKARRAQNENDYETWVAGGVVPTLNAFDNGDIRTTVLIMRQREGKPGGGKGPMLSERSFTLATNNDQTVFILDGTRVDDVRVIDTEIVPTVISRWGTGGGNVPAIMAFDTYNQSISEKAKTLNSAASDVDHTGAVWKGQTVRRLTPVECERLQGFPDGWTEGQADSNRYKQMGNAVAVPVVSWLIKRLMEASNDMD
jgi:DNA (cytosine-5)-methyltransferase 1